MVDSISSGAKAARGAFASSASRVHQPSKGFVRSLLKPGTTIPEGSGSVATQKVQGVPESGNSQDQVHQSDQPRVPQLGDQLDITT